MISIARICYLFLNRIAIRSGTNYDTDVCIKSIATLTTDVIRAFF